MENSFTCPLAHRFDSERDALAAANAERDHAAS
jgi:hypothetical protein